MIARSSSFESWTGTRPDANANLSKTGTTLGSASAMSLPAGSGVS
jgi:hypothetical protein